MEAQSETNEAAAKAKSKSSPKYVVSCILMHDVGSTKPLKGKGLLQAPPHLPTNLHSLHHITTPMMAQICVMGEPKESEGRQRETTKRKNYGRKGKDSVQKRQIREKVARIVEE